MTISRSSDNIQYQSDSIVAKIGHAGPLILVGALESVVGVGAPGFLHVLCLLLAFLPDYPTDPLAEGMDHSAFFSLQYGRAAI